MSNTKWPQIQYQVKLVQAGRVNSKNICLSHTALAVCFFPKIYFHAYIAFILFILLS